MVLWQLFNGGVEITISGLLLVQVDLPLMHVRDHGQLLGLELFEVD